MLVQEEGKHPVHFPDGDVFSFDGEVANIFPNMAERSIPMYKEAHRLHSALLHDRLHGGLFRVVDVGASRGGFLEEICRQHGMNASVSGTALDLIAIDNSEPMLRLLAKDMPFVATVHADIRGFEVFPENVDVISMFYVLQFIQQPAEKLEVLRWAYRSLRPGGMLFLGQKEDTHTTFLPAFTKEYIAFRRRNGYTDQEIAAKTAALKHAMWPSSSAWLEDMAYKAGFTDYAETTRWLQFSTSVCAKA